MAIYDAMTEQEYITVRKGLKMRAYKSEGGQGWFIRFSCKSHNEAGRRISWTRTNPIEIRQGQKPLDWLSKNLPANFYGCGVEITTPIHHNTAVVEPDYPHKANFV